MNNVIKTGTGATLSAAIMIMATNALASVPDDTVVDIPNSWAPDDLLSPDIHANLAKKVVMESLSRSLDVISEHYSVDGGETIHDRYIAPLKEAGAQDTLVTDFIRALYGDDMPIQLAQEVDSTSIGSGISCYSNCYSNCHSACHSACHGACHGSRGWR